MSNSSESWVDRALAVRASLLSDPALDAVRVFHGAGDGLDGLVVEKFGPVCIVQLHEEKLNLSVDEVRALAELFHRRLGVTATYRKAFLRDRARIPAHIAALHTDPRPWIGEASEEEFAVRENGLRLLIRPYAGFSVGLFLEHRDNRRRVRERASGRRVLNVFSYTGGFSVAAAMGGAASVASVDVSRKYLEWSRRNFAASSLDTSPHRFYCSDVFEFYGRARRQGLRYDLIVLDPPTFSRRPGTRKVFEIERDLDRLVAGAVELLDPGGLIFLATNSRGLPAARLEESLIHALGPGRFAISDRPVLPVDFAGDAGFSKSVWARLEG